MAISVEIRQQAVDYYLCGEDSYESVAARFSVGTASVKRWVKQYQETGSLKPKSGPRGRKPVLHGENLEKLKMLIEEDGSRDQLELVKLLWSRHQIKSSTSAVSRALIRNQLTRRKSSPAPVKRERVPQGWTALPPLSDVSRCIALHRPPSSQSAAASGPESPPTPRATPRAQRSGCAGHEPVSPARSSGSEA